MPAEPTGAPAFLGIDLGGTKTLALVATVDGNLLAEATLPTPASEPADAIVATMVVAAGQALANARTSLASVGGAGIAAAGAVDGRNGVLVHAPQLPRIDHTPMVALVHAALGVPIVIGNDANLAALGEQRYGAGKGVPNLLYITVSTGIGGGIIIDNHLYEGADGYAGEVGHMSVDAHGPMGRSTVLGALESMASGTALGRIAVERLSAGEHSSMRTAFEANGAAAITAPVIFDALREGDPLARSIVEDAVVYLGTGLTGLVNVLNPGLIIIGGGLSNEWADYIAPAVDMMRRHAFAGVGQHTKAVPPALGMRAGALGAVALAADMR